MSRLLARSLGWPGREREGEGERERERETLCLGPLECRPLTCGHRARSCAPREGKPSLALAEEEEERETDRADGKGCEVFVEVSFGSSGRCWLSIMLHDFPDGPENFLRNGLFSRPGVRDSASRSCSRLR